MTHNYCAVNCSHAKSGIICAHKGTRLESILMFHVIEIEKFAYIFNLSASEQDSPVPSGSTFIDFMTPFSKTIE